MIGTVGPVPTVEALDIRIRPEAADDAGAIEAVTRAAFLDAPHTSHTEQFVLDALRRAGRLSIALVAELRGEIVGHVAVSPVSISDGSSGWFGLGPISVLPRLQRRGAGSLLMREALRILREAGASGCVLLGDPVYYRRFGFRPVAGLVLPDVPPEYFQALSFVAPCPQGVVSYHESFAATR